jgi:hypothetical protein
VFFSKRISAMKKAILIKQDLIIKKRSAGKSRASD